MQTKTAPVTGRRVGRVGCLAVRVGAEPLLPLLWLRRWLGPVLRGRWLLRRLGSILLGLGLGRRLTLT